MPPPQTKKEDEEEFDHPARVGGMLVVSHVNRQQGHPQKEAYTSLAGTAQSSGQDEGMLQRDHTGQFQGLIVSACAIQSGRGPSVPVQKWGVLIARCRHKAFSGKKVIQGYSLFLAPPFLSIFVTAKRTSARGSRSARHDRDVNLQLFPKSRAGTSNFESELALALRPRPGKNRSPPLLHLADGGKTRFQRERVKGSGCYPTVPLGWHLAFTHIRNHRRCPKSSRWGWVWGVAVCSRWT